MEENRINEIISTSLDKIKELSETGTVIGEQIKTESGTVLIPISKVSLGFVSGGVDFSGKKVADEKSQKNGVSFAGGGGTGLTVSPIGFLVIKPSGDVSMLNVKSPDVVYNNSTVAAVGNIIEKSPEVLKKLKEVFKKDEKPVEACFTEDTEE